MGINKPEMSAHVIIMGTLTRVSDILGKHLIVSYKKKKFNNEYKGVYFTHCYELFLNKKYIITVYGDGLLLYGAHLSIAKAIRDKLKPVCKLKRKKNVKKFVKI